MSSSTRSTVLALGFALLLVRCGGAADPHPPPAPSDFDAGGDATIPDTGTTDTSTVDAIRPDTAVPDAPSDAPRDAGADASLDAGPPVLATSKTSVDFGQVACGQSAQPISFAINNGGVTAFTWSAAFLNGGTTLFSLVPASGSVGPGSSQTVTLSMSKVPYPGSTATGFYSDVLTITASGTSNVSQSIPITLTGKGAVLRFSPSAVDFGNVPLNSAPTDPINIVNDGNASAEINLILNNPRFARSPLGPIVVNGAATVTLQASFAASDTVPQQGTMTMAATANPNNAFCQDLPAGLQLSGTGTNGTASVSPSSVSFGNAGLVDCGTQAASQLVTISNAGNAPFNWTATLTSGASYYSVSPPMGTVQPSGSQTLQVVPNPLPQASAVTPDLYGGTVSITTTAANDSVHIVQLHQTAHGVILSSTLGGQTLAFGGVSIGQTASSQFSVSNNGNAPTTITFAHGSSAFTVSSGFPIAASQSVAPTVTFSPTAIQSYTDTVIMTVPSGTALCGPVPANTGLTGTGTTGVSVAPTSLDFGLVSCGLGAAPYQTTTISNTGPNMTYTPTFAAGANSPYTLADNTGAAITPGNPIALAAGTSATLRIVPKPIAAPASTSPDAFADTLTITTSSAGDSPHNIALHQTARGAVLVLSPAAISTSAPQGLEVFVGFSVTNSGNYSVGYTLQIMGPANAFSSNLTGGTVVGGGVQNGTLTCTGPLKGTQAVGSLQITPNAGSILCADPPPNMPLSIVGQ